MVSFLEQITKDLQQLPTRQQKFYLQNDQIHSLYKQNALIFISNDYQQQTYYTTKFKAPFPSIMTQLRSIINQPRDNPHHALSPCSIFEMKITHELDNQGCKCTLCQKVVHNELKVVRKTEFRDLESQQTMGKKEEFLTQFLCEFFCIDKMNRKIKILLPQMCIFQKGNPTCLITKKKDIMPMKLLKNKQKMNAFEIQNFFMQGYIYHNNLKQNQEIMKNHKVTTLKKEYYKFDEYLKNECIVIVKFINGTCQMMTPVQLSNLFKCKLKHVRQQISYIQTMVCAQDYNELRMHIDLTTREYQLQINELYERAKNEVKMINENIKPKEFMFVLEREERMFEEDLRRKNEKDYIKYLALKFLLIYSLKTDILLEKCLFKFMRDPKNSYYYIIDIQAYQKTSAARLWGEFEKKKAESPTKANIKRRPASSPEKIQTRRRPTKTQNEESNPFDMKKLVMEVNDDDNFSYNIKKSRQCKKQIKKVEDKIKGSLFKLEPIKKNPQRIRRLVSCLISQNEDTSKMLKRFL